MIATKQSIKDKPRKEEKSAISSIISKIPLGNLIGGFIVILVAINLIPTIANQIVDTTSGNQEDSTNTSSFILSLTTGFFVLGILVAGVCLAVGGPRKGGLV